jgi:uncharacterized protein YecE (DUF72 family)
MPGSDPGRIARASAEQLDLFAGDPAHGPAAPGRTSVAPADAGERVHALARTLPPGLHMGTSSWAFPGWAGLVYDREYSLQRLARHGLQAYARHPLLGAVGIDRTHYAPIDARAFATYAGQVPERFRFLAKAHELCTLARFPEHPRYGNHRGQINAQYLDPAYASDQVVAPFATGLGDRAGPLLFQFAPQPMELLGGPARFADDLHAFLSALPRGVLYAVEVRNAALVTPAYARALADAGAIHCINLIPGMPPPLAQWRITASDAAPAVLVRWMLARHMDYARAEEAYRPFGAIVDADPVAVQSIAHLVRSAPARPAYVIVNNKAEGSAPLSIVRLAEELAADDVPF